MAGPLEPMHPRSTGLRCEDVGHVWPAAPELRALEVGRLEGSRGVAIDTLEGEPAMREEPFEAIDLPPASRREA